ncbi:MAG: hypothetical protein IPM47_07110 [Sphingobacteriales bacterium]|nr:MAG: hypothetical protein IPM47_07110 [Sphingobacteriales bacterium]
MNIVSEKSEKLTLLTTITINSEDYKATYLKSLKEMAKKATVNGFRKGMMPLPLFQKMHGKSILLNELLDIANKAYQESFSVSEFNLFGNPILADEVELTIDPQDLNKTYTFVFETGIIPDLDINELTNIKTEFVRYTPEVDEEIITSEIKTYQRKLGNTVILEEIVPIGETDVLKVFIEEVDSEGIVISDGIKNETVITLDILNKGEEYDKLSKLQLNESAIINIFDAFPHDKNIIARQLLGLSDYTDALSSSYKVTINEVSRLELMPIGEELFKLVFPNEEVADEKAFRDLIRKNIQDYYNLGSDMVLRYHIQKALESYHVELPFEYIQKFLIGQNDKETYNLASFIKAYEAFKLQFWQMAIEKVTKLEVSNEDLASKARKYIYRKYNLDYNINLPEELLEQVIYKELENPDFKESLVQEIKTEKALNYLISVLPVKNQTISTEEYFVMLQTYKFRKNPLTNPESDETNSTTEVAAVEENI